MGPGAHHFGGHHPRCRTVTCFASWTVHHQRFAERLNVSCFGSRRSLQPCMHFKQIYENSISRTVRIFFSVRRLLGSRQVVIQCLCQLNELCSILHRLLFKNIKREHGPIHSPNIVHVQWRPHEEKHTKKTKTTKAQNPTKAKQTKAPNQNHEKATSSQWTKQLHANRSNLCAND